jgi:hypothetical protein
VSEALQQAPTSRVSFLASFGTRLHASTVRVLFGTLAIPDDNRVLDSTGSSRWPLVAQIVGNPERYGRAVKSLVVQQSALDASGQILPLESQHFNSILEACVNLEEIVWNSSFVPPDGICEVSLLRVSKPKSNSDWHIPDDNFFQSPSISVNLP